MRWIARQKYRVGFLTTCSTIPFCQNCNSKWHHFHHQYDYWIYAAYIILSDFRYV